MELAWFQLSLRRAMVLLPAVFLFSFTSSVCYVVSSSALLSGPAGLPIIAASVCFGCCILLWSRLALVVPCLGLVASLLSR